MLIRPGDAAIDDDEWRALLAQEPVGQLITPRADGLPEITPSHFAFDGASRIEMHLAKGNPVWPLIGSGCRGLFSVVGSFVYIPTGWNASPGEAPDYGVPTSYYAAAVAEVQAAPIDDPAEVAALLTRLLGRFQPEGGHAPVEPGDTHYGKLLGAIRGLHLDIISVEAKFKFGGNKGAAHQREIAARLTERAEPGDRQASAHQQRRLASG